MLKLTEIVKEYPIGDGSVTALRGVSLDFRANEFVSILGPSGCGKTTLLNIIGGLDHYTSGDLVIRGTSTKEYRDAEWDAYRNHSVGFVFQSYNLIPHQSVLSNVELALTLSGVSKAERRRRAEEALVRVGLGEHLHKRPNQLSGGQMQRVAIARSLVNNPDILLADEPTGALDTETSVAVMDLLREVAKEKLVVMVTHNPELAEEYSTRIIRLLDGRVVGDTNPYTSEDAVPEQVAEAIEETPAPTEKKKRVKAKKRSMSFLTALSLSLNNLMTKKGRTFLTSFAGSIGIIGIALILALSTGINAYITKIQEDTLTSYPISINREEADIGAMISSMMGAGETSAQHGKDKVYSSAVFYSLINMMLAPEMNTNNLKKFKEYLESDGVLDGIDATLQYGYDIPLIIYTTDENGNRVKSDIMALFEKVGFVGSSDEESAVGGSVSTSFSGFSVWQEVMPGKDGAYVSDIIKEQYDLIHGDWPTSKTDVLLVVDEKNEVNDMTLYALGLKSEEEMTNLLMSALGGTPVDTEAVESWDYDEIVNQDREYQLLIAGDRFQLINGVYTDVTSGNFESQLDLVLENSLKLHVSGIIRPNPDATASSANGTLLYTSALTQHILAETLESAAVKAQLATPDVDIFTGLPFELDEALKPSTDAERIAALRKYVYGDGGESGISDAQKAELLHKWLTTPTEAYIAEKVGEALGKINALPTDEEKIEAMKAEVKQMIGKFYAVDVDALDAMLDNIAEKNGMEALLTFYTDFRTTVASMMYTAEQEVVYETIRSTPSDAVLAEIAQQFLDRAGENVSVFTIMTLSSATGMSLLEAGAWYNGLDAAGKSNADMKAARFAALESYPQMAVLYADQNCAAKLDEMIENADDGTLAWVYTSFVPDGSSTSTYADNLAALGYGEADSPDSINIYVGSFAEKERINAIIADYNESVESEEDEISYTDYVTLIMSSVTTILDAITYVLIAFVSVSLVVSSIMIGIITYISVLERTKEIGILRAIGASKRDVSRVFNAETLIVGFSAGMIGIIVTLLLCIPINLILRFVTGIPSIGAQLPIGAAAILVGISMLLTLIAGLLPSRIAARKDPVIALRTE